MSHARVAVKTGNEIIIGASCSPGPDDGGSIESCSAYSCLALACENRTDPNRVVTSIRIAILYWRDSPVLHYYYTLNNWL